MVTKQSRLFISRLLLLSAAVTFLPSCKFPFGSSTPSHECCPCPHDLVEEDVKVEGVDPTLLKETLVSFEGKPVISGHDYEKNLQLIMETQPTIKEMLPYIPADQQDQIYNQLLEGMAMEKLMLRWVKDAGLDKSAEYIKNARRVHEAVDRDLALRTFENELLKEIVISDEEAEKFYETNKTTDQTLQRPPFLVQQGGIQTRGFEVSDEKEAQQLAERARKESFDTVAEQAKKTITDYGLVNQQSYIDASVKQRILATTTFPTIEVVKGTDNKYYVIQVERKQEPQYAPFSTAKEGIKQMLTGKKFNDLYNKKIADLKDQYKMEVNKEYLKQRKAKTASLAAPAEAEEVETSSPHTPQAA